MNSVSSIGIGSGQPLPVLQPAPSSGEGTGVNAGQPGTSGTSKQSSADAQSPTASATPTSASNSPANVASQVQALAAKMAQLNPELTYVVNPSGGEPMIQLMDRATNQVIQQFPSAAAIQITKELDRFENGKVINKTA